LVIGEVNTMSAAGKFFKILFGLLLIVAGVLSYTRWYMELLTLIKGALGLFVMMLGLLFLVIGWSD